MAEPKRLGKLIKKQLACWPHPSFNLSKIRIDDLRLELLNPKNGFGKPVEAPASVANPVNASTVPVNTSANSNVVSVPHAATAAAAAPVHAAAAAIPVNIATSLTTPNLVTPNNSDVQGSEGGTSDSTSIQSSCGSDESWRPESETFGFHVLLHDHRHEPTRKVATLVYIKSKDVDTDPISGKRFADARALISELQKTHSAIRGSVRLAHPYPGDITYLEYFGMNTHGKLEESDFSPGQLLVTPPACIHIHIEQALDGATVLDTLPEAHHPKEEIKESPAPLSPQDLVVDWLHAQLASQDDYDFFIASRHRVLPNPEVVRVWKFVSTFDESYHASKNNPAQKRVTKAALQQALGVGETWYNEALNGNRLAVLYGPGGACASEEVQKELEKADKPPHGRDELLRFLKEWQTTHAR
ncbi:hypothetical protein NLJ89_g8790 [Agrocybe chaxingu]|uniref:Uncharacterized protein n=1 Tax=Agrocybe chaxingu TaxID=84603 RepID=A0A9W8JWX8_9AGAR|nr:hypothetical protein NLJ89_g8790 [Agrocybe chaxingu]